MTEDSVLEFDAVRKSYGPKCVLDGATFTIRAGTVVGLVGANGAGKTTLMRIAAGLQLPDGGRVSIRHGGYFGGFETLPVGGSENDLRRGLGLETRETGSVRLSTLSRGELQTVGLSAAFELSCDILLLDEPWTGLEPDRRDTLSARITDYARAGRATISLSPSLYAGCAAEYKKAVNECSSLDGFIDRSICGLDAAVEYAGCVRRTIMG